MRPTMDVPNYRQHIQWFVLLCVNLTIPAFLIWQFRSGEITQVNAVICAAICIIGLNALVLYGFDRGLRRNGVRVPAKLPMVAAMFGLAAFGATALTVSHVAQQDRYMDLAASNVPLDSIQPLRTRLVVELVRQTAANSRENDNLLRDVQKHPLDPQVYTPASFSSIQVMNRTVTRLTEIIAADNAYYAKQQAARQRFRDQMAIVDPAYLDSWDKASAAQEGAEAATEELEKEWLESVRVLYSYASQHSRELRIRDGQLQFSTPALNDTFRNQMSRSQALHDQLLDAVQRGAEARRRAEKNIAAR